MRFLNVLRFRRPHETFNEILAREAGLDQTAATESARLESGDLDQDDDSLLSPRDVSELATALQQVVRDAKPLRFTGLVRVRRETVYEILDQLRVSFVVFFKEYRYRQANTGAAESTETSDSVDAFLSQVDAIDDLVYRGRPIPITNDVWVNRAALSERIDTLSSFLTVLTQELAAYRAADSTPRPQPET